MGMDIHLHIVHKGEVLAKSIFDGRNSDWFGNMIGRHISEPAYRQLPYEYDWNCEGNCPENLKEEYLGELEDFHGRWTFDERSVNVGDFREWYMKYKPCLKAGYVSKYDAWLYEKKNIIPYLESVEHFLDEDDKSDKVWLEFNDPYEPSCWLYKYLARNEVPDEAWLVYCFDN